MRTLLVSASIGGIDPLRTLPPLPSDVMAMFYTDARILEAARSWTRVRHVPPSLNSRLASKWYKCQVYRTESAESATHLVWSDACIKFNSLDFIVPLLDDRAVFVPHPDRKSVADEYAYVLRQLAQGNPYLSRRYDSEALERERTHFAARHDLERLQLWCGGLWIVPNTPQVHAFLDAWWKVINTFSIFDQAAISPLLVEYGIEVNPLGVSIYKNDLFERVSHA